MRMRIQEATNQRINEYRDIPRYRTKRGRLLWIAGDRYDDYSSAANCKILVDVYGKFWGYSDSSQIERI